MTSVKISKSDEFQGALSVNFNNLLFVLSSIKELFKANAWNILTYKILIFAYLCVILSINESKFWNTLNSKNSYSIINDAFNKKYIFWNSFII